MQNSHEIERYNNVAITLHWIMALAILGMLASGFIMGSPDLSPQVNGMLYWVHKSMGVLILLTVVVRILWRLSHAAPTLPTSLPKLDVIGAKIGHVLLYVFMFAMPLSGWLLVSGSMKSGAATPVFDLFNWPHIPGLKGNEAVTGIAREGHGIMAWIILGLIVVHIAAVVKHALWDKVNILPRMLPACPVKAKKQSCCSTCHCGDQKTND